MNACSSTCPNGFYPDITLVCLACNTTCTTCSSFNVCTSCTTTFLSNTGQCVSSSSCQSGTYGSTSNYTCSPCTSPCATCNQSATNCTSCITNTWLTNNQCQSSCPNGFYNDSTGVCLSCVTPCTYCTTKSSCTKCNNPYFLSGFFCVTSSSCPNGTYP
jgi:proprotein convertase subtilisin/kexin type 5